MGPLMAYVKNITYHLQITDYDRYYNRVENIFLSAKPPKLNHFINNQFQYEGIDNPAPVHWRNDEIFLLVPAAFPAREIKADLIIPKRFPGQIDVEVIGRMTPMLRHISRKVYHIYNNNGRLWENASKQFLQAGLRLRAEVRFSCEAKLCLQQNEASLIFPFAG